MRNEYNNVPEGGGGGIGSLSVACDRSFHIQALVRTLVMSSVCYCYSIFPPYFHSKIFFLDASDINHANIVCELQAYDCRTFACNTNQITMEINFSACYSILFRTFVQMPLAELFSKATCC